jgi:hypothetical protein
MYVTTTSAPVPFEGSPELALEDSLEGASGLDVDKKNWSFLKPRASVRESQRESHFSTFSGRVYWKNSSSVSLLVREKVAMDPL